MPTLDDATRAEINTQIRQLSHDMLAELRAWLVYARIVPGDQPTGDQTLGATISAFLDDTGIVVSPITRANHQSALRALVAHLAAYGLTADSPIRDLRPEHLLTWAAWLINTRHLGKQSIQNHMNSLSRYLEHLRLRAQLPFTISEMTRIQDGIRLTRIAHRPDQRLPRPISDDDIERLLTVARQQPTDSARDRLATLRNIAIVLTLRSTGARVMEISGLRLHDLRDDRSAIIIGKRHKERTIYFDTASWTAIAAYLAARHLGQVGQADPVFIRHDDRAGPVSYTHLRAHETVLDLVCRLLLEKTKHKKKTQHTHNTQ